MFVLVTVSVCESLELYTDNNYCALCNPNYGEFVATCFPFLHLCFLESYMLNWDNLSISIKSFIQQHYCVLFRNDKLVKEKMEIEKKLETFQREVKHVSKANTAKEIRVLKKVVQNLEVCRCSK